MKQPLVSIIMPCYNGEDFIDRSIDSIYQQDYDNIELIVVDDGSTDNSKEIIMRWKEKFANDGKELKYVYQKNRGLGGAINTGLKYVSGYYISLLDVDDEYLPHCISERVRYLSEHPDISIVRTNGYIVSSDSKRLFTTDEQEKSMQDVFLGLLTWKTYNWAGSYMLCSKDLFDFYPDRNIYESKDGQNLQLMLPLLYRKKCGFIDKPHMNYNRQPDSLSQSSDADEKEAKMISVTKGYTDIRIYMIGIIVKNESEKDYFIQQINYAQYRFLLNMAKAYGDKELLKSSMKELKGDAENKLDNKIIYYSVISPVLSYFLRLIRKIRNLLSGSDKNAAIT